MRTNTKLTALVNSILLIVALAVSASAQTTIEDFNTDGDGSRYTIEGRFLEAADNLWTTLPDANIVPGLPLLAGIDTGGLLFDGTAAPARRVIFPTERRTNAVAADRPGTLNAVGLGLMDAAVGWAAPGASRNIVFVTGDGLFDGQFNTIWRDRLTGLGHTVSAVADETAVVTTGVDLFIVASNGDGGENAKYKDVAVPLIAYDALSNDDLSLTSDRGDNFRGDTFEIVGAGHPLANGLANGPVAISDGGVTEFNLAVDRGAFALAPGATLIMKLEDDAVSFTPGDLAFTGFEGAGYLAGADLDAGDAGVAVQLNPIDTSGIANPELLISLAARTSGGFDLADNNAPFDAATNPALDFIRILADPENDGTFVDVAQILPLDRPGDGRLVAPDGSFLTDAFQDFTFGIPSSSNLVLRIEANSTAGGERLAIDDMRVIPEPGSLVLGLMGLLAGVGCRRRRRN